MICPFVVLSTPKPHFCVGSPSFITDCHQVGIAAEVMTTGAGASVISVFSGTAADITMLEDAVAIETIFCAFAVIAAALSAASAISVAEGESGVFGGRVFGSKSGTNRMPPARD